MLKKLLNRIQKLEQQKQIKVDKQSQIQAEIDDIDVKLKKLYYLAHAAILASRWSIIFLNELMMGMN